MIKIKFVELQNELFKLFEKRDFEAMHRLIHKAQKDFPERLDKTSFWKACAYSLQGKQEEALAILNAALTKGVWWNPYTLMSDPDLHELQSREEFKLIVKKCEDILNNHQLNSSSKLFVYGNEGSNTGIFSLHWRGSDVNDFAPYWYDDELLHEYILGFPQSSQIYGVNSYCWDKRDVALNDISTTFRDFKEKYNMEQIIIAGASQGGNLAIELSLNDNLLATKGFIAVIPAIRDIESIEKLIQTKKVANLKGCIITGDKDPFYKKTIELMPIFEKYDIKCKLIVKEGLGHLFPDDFTKLLSEAVQYIVEPN